MHSLYVTGTDTGVGKTHASVALLHALRARGLRVAGMKPVAAGCQRVDGQWRNDDALALQAASDRAAPYAELNSFALPLPSAPQLAARAAGVRVDLAVLADAFERLQARADAVVVEGAGGWLAPFDDGLEQSALVRRLQLPVVLVVGMRLGCLNHARLSARVIADDGCRLLGWIGNAVEAGFDDNGDYARLLQQQLPAPCLGLLAHGMSPVEAAANLRLP
ncbi:MAG: dethiobiotin synthase [Pseudoxanthomonas suwonensis]|nr:dethiobiotin synthase [Pseudoxanthomonas suwonensis]